MRNYYEILEVNPRASSEMITKVYKILIKKYHPDLYEESQKIEMEEKIKEINEAYEILSDEEKRKKYDLELEEKEKKINEENYETEGVKYNNNDFTSNSVNDNEAYNNDKDVNQIMINQINRFENILNKYEQALYNYSNLNNNINNQEYYEEEPRREVTKMDIFKYKLQRVFTIVGIVAITILILLLVPFTRDLIVSVLSVFIKK